ncbi:hypothetical protein EBZ80_00460 [bacterium]|nr:hypothetical protein [bacterium]
MKTVSPLIVNFVALVGLLLAVQAPVLAAGKKSADEAVFDQPQMETGNESTKRPDASGEAEFGAPARELPSDARVEDIVEPSADYHYAGFGKADPFQPPVTVKSIVPDAVEIPIVSPLQRHPLSALKLVGVWARSPGERKALLMTPGMEGIIVRVGDLAGNGGGKVVAIDEVSVVVREFLIANDGTRQFSDVRLVFDAKTPSVQHGATGGAIVIAPGASKPDVQLPAGASTAVGPAPANQTPANLLPALQGAAAAAAPATGATAAGATASQPGVPAATAAATPAPTQPQRQADKPVFNF